jgi:acyl-CoA reductase-like NAD-dependent aldehyde dehydrogenase
MSLPTISTVSPSTNEVILQTPEATLADVKAAAAASQVAFQSWRRTPFEQRKAIVTKALKLLQDRKQELGRELTEQMGRPIAYGVKEIETMQKRADYLLDIAANALSDIPGRPEANFQRWIRRDPVGPVLIMFAWNFPYLVIVNALVPALLAGDTVLLKPSPQTPLVGSRFAEIFTEAGLPENVLQIVQCGNPRTLEEIVKLPEIGLITFTGSTAGGLALRAASAGRVVPINLELGGNDPAYVRPDADLKYVAAQLVDGAIFNSGQSCCAVERVYVHESVYDEFIEELQKDLLK